MSGVPDVFARIGRSANLLVSGIVGAGKTTLVRKIVRTKVATSGAEVRWVDMRDTTVASLRRTLEDLRRRDGLSRLTVLVVDEVHGISRADLHGELGTLLESAMEPCSRAPWRGREHRVRTILTSYDPGVFRDAFGSLVDAQCQKILAGTATADGLSWLDPRLVPHTEDPSDRHTLGRGLYLPRQASAEEDPMDLVQPFWASRRDRLALR